MIFMLLVVEYIAGKEGRKDRQKSSFPKLAISREAVLLGILFYNLERLRSLSSIRKMNRVSVGERQKEMFIVFTFIGKTTGS